MYRLLFYIVFTVASCLIATAQQHNIYDKKDINVLEKVVIDGDTLLLSSIEEVKIYSPRKFKNRFQAWRYRRLIYNVKKAYPYALLAAKKLEELNTELQAIEGERKRKAFLQQAEKEIKAQFENELKGLTITQGRILIKLIDRETGETSYELVKELRGTFSAVLWQTVARLFGSNLKTEFDAEGEDKLIDEIVRLIDAGQL